MKDLSDLVRDPAERVLARRSLSDFCARMDPSYESTLHTRKIVDVLEALEKGDVNRVILSVPPRHGKTYHAGERFPAWLIGRNPRLQIIAASYALELSLKSTRAARNLVADERYPFDVSLTTDSHAAGRWQTTHGGMVFAAGVGGAMTGFGAHGLIIDDPVKDRQEANSELIQGRTWDWYTDVARTRLMRGGWQLVMMTRWGENDLAGRLLNSKGASDWYVLNLPAIAVENDPIGRAPGEILWANGPPLPSVEKGEISAQSFEALYQGNPHPDDGTLFRRAWLKRRWVQLPEFKRACVFIDGAWKEGIANDRSAMALWATDGIDYWLVDMWAGRVEYPDLKTKALAFWTQACERVPQTNALAVEDAASGTALVQEFRRSTRIPIVGVKVDKDKFTRAEAHTPLFEGGKISIPSEHILLDSWIEEHIRFPNGKHDDFVDTTSGALTRLASSTSISWGKVNTLTPLRRRF